MNKNKKQKCYSIIFEHLDIDNLQKYTLNLQKYLDILYKYIYIYKVLYTKMNHKIFNVSNC